MINITFTQEQKNIFFEEYQHHSHPKIRRRMGILFFKSEGLAHKEICRLFRITKPTLSKTLKLYNEQGLEGVKRNYKHIIFSKLAVILKHKRHNSPQKGFTKVFLKT